MVALRLGRFNLVRAIRRRRRALEEAWSEVGAETGG